MSPRTIDGSNPSEGVSKSPTYTVKHGGTSGTYSTPTGCSYIIVEIQGAGGSGGRSAGNTPGGGGGSGGYIRAKMAAGSYSYSVGLGGSVVTANNTDGTSGGPTTFGGWTCNGGGGGSANPAYPGPYGSYTGSGGTVLFQFDGCAGTAGSAYASTTLTAPGGSSWFAPSSSTIPLGYGGKDGTYGSGGHGTNASTASFPSGVSGGGGNGVIFITEYY